VNKTDAQSPLGVLAAAQIAVKKVIPAALGMPKAYGSYELKSGLRGTRVSPAVEAPDELQRDPGGTSRMGSGNALRSLGLAGSRSRFQLLHAVVQGFHLQI